MNPVIANRAAAGRVGNVPTRVIVRRPVAGYAPGMKATGAPPVFVSEGVERELVRKGRSPEQLEKLSPLCREDVFGVWLYLSGEDDTYGQWYPLTTQD